MNRFHLKYFFIAFAIISVAACKNGGNKSGDNQTAFGDSAVQSITEQINSAPDKASLYYERGRAFEKIEKDSLALKDFKKAASLDSTKAEYFSAVGDLLFEHKDITGSVLWIEKALTLNPEDPKAHLKLAKMFLFIKDYNGAFKQINTVLRADVYNAEGYFLKGMIYKDMKDTSHAISSFRTAVQVAPDYRDAVIQLGLVYSTMGDAIALKYFDNAFKMDTTDVFPLFAKGVFYQDKNQFEQAKAEYKNVIMHEREYPDAYYNTAFILMQQDSLDKAWRQYDILTKIDPASAEAYYNRGFCSEKMGKKQEAIADYKQALVFDDQYANAKEALKTLGVK